MNGGIEADFQETQRFISRGLGRVLVMAALLTDALYVQLAFGRGGGLRRDAVLVALLLLLGPAFAYLWLRVELSVEVRVTGLDLRYFPFVRRLIQWHEILSCDPRTYRWREWGGFGIQGTRQRRAYSVRGDGAVELTLADGRSLWIGSQRPHDLERAIRIHLGPSGHGKTAARRAALER